MAAEGRRLNTLYENIKNQTSFEETAKDSYISWERYKKTKHFVAKSLTLSFMLLTCNNFIARLLYSSRGSSQKVMHERLNNTISECFIELPVKDNLLQYFAGCKVAEAVNYSEDTSSFGHSIWVNTSIIQSYRCHAMTKDINLDKIIQALLYLIKWTLYYITWIDQKQRVRNASVIIKTCD